MHNLATAVVQRYLAEDFLPKMNLAITERILMNNVPQLLANKVMGTIIVPNIKNNNEP
jgi:hypothetical protein